MYRQTGIRFKRPCGSTFCQRDLLSKHVKLEQCQIGLAAGDVCIILIFFKVIFETKCVNNWNKKLELDIIVSVNNHFEYFCITSEMNTKKLPR